MMTFNGFMFIFLCATIITAAQVRTTDGASTSEECPMNLCFALDGSSSIERIEFRRQRFLVNQIVRRIPENLEVGFAAVQYGVQNIAISPLTFSRDTFRRRLRGSVQEEAEGTFLAAGINYCFSQLFEPDIPITCGKNKMIIMGDGIGNIGADPVERARLYESLGGDVITVSFGTNVNITVLAKIAGSEDDVFGGSVGLRYLAGKIVSKFLSG